MLVGANGAPLGVQELKKIVISENDIQGKKAWGVEFHPHIEAFEFEEVFQILGDVIRGIAQNARARKHEAMKMRAVKEQMAAIQKEETK